MDKIIKQRILKIGENIEAQILKKGFSSVYDFWINSEDPIPKSTLHDIISGKSDPRISTLIAISESLEIPLSSLLDS